MYHLDQHAIIRKPSPPLCGTVDSFGKQPIVGDQVTAPYPSRIAVRSDRTIDQRHEQCLISRDLSDHPFP